VSAEERRGSLHELPEGLPVPVDDGASDHLPLTQIPPVSLPSTTGESVNLAEVATQGRTVLFFYPRSGRPDEPPIPGWDDIPGARGCTPQSCAFRDSFPGFETLGVRVFGVSAQDTAYQREFAERNHLPYPLLSDERFALTEALRLPTFEAGSMRLIKRLTLVVSGGRVEKVFYPVFPPDKNAEEVLAYLGLSHRPSPEPPTTRWKGGKEYEAYVGRWSRLIAPQFLEWLDAPSGIGWLDVGCGTGELTKAIVETQSPNHVAGIDSSEEYVAFAREQVTDERVHFDVGDAMNLPYHEEEFEAAVAGLVLNHLSDPVSALRGMTYVTTCVDGVLGAYVWDYPRVEMMRYFWEAAKADPAARALDEKQRFGLCRPDVLQVLFDEAHLNRIEVLPMDVPMHFHNFEEYWEPFLGGQGVAPAYCMSLSNEDRTELRERIRSTLPVERDGTIHLAARVWAVKGIT
jgi:peroxiredoxin/trans-aconitate methyltransferase